MKIVLPIAALLVSALLGTLPDLNFATALAAAAPARYQRSERSYTVPDVVLIDQEARSVPLRDLLNGDRPVLVNFVFASCTTICPMLTATFGKAQALLSESDEPFLLVSVSIDPEQDTPDQLKKYAERFKAGPNWRFLTGELGKIETVQKAFGAYRGSKANHPSLILIHAHATGPWISLEGSISAAELVEEFHKAKAHP